MPKVTMGHRMELIRFYFHGYPCQAIPEKSSVAKGSVVNVTEIQLLGQRGRRSDQTRAPEEHEKRLKWNCRSRGVRCVVGLPGLLVNQPGHDGVPVRGAVMGEGFPVQGPPQDEVRLDALTDNCRG